MIQRIQSLYLLLTTIVSGLFLNGKILVFQNQIDSETILSFNGIYQKIPGDGTEIIGKMIPITIISAIIPLLSFFTIFLFKRRKLQIRFTLAILVLELFLILATVLYSLNIVRMNSYSVTAGINVIFPILAILFTLLAYRGIKRDEDLVRSYDRLR
jgi:hypothetical protein